MLSKFSFIIHSFHITFESFKLIAIIFIIAYVYLRWVFFYFKYNLFFSFPGYKESLSHPYFSRSSFKLVVSDLKKYIIVLFHIIFNKSIVGKLSLPFTNG